MSRIIGTFRAGRHFAKAAQNGTRTRSKGFGFVIPLEPDLHEDLFIPPDATAGAMTGDTVAARVLRRRRRAGRLLCSGEVIEVLERAQNRFVGTLLKTKDGWIVQPDGKGFTEPICVDDVGAKAAVNKDKVVVEIVSWPTATYLAQGVITERLGKAGRYDSEIKSIIRQYHLPDEFDETCLAQASSAAAEFRPERIDGREDITEKIIITIDPPDAKDFDDAISLDKNAEGNPVLGIHIADVSLFIPPDSPLDTEAKNRGNSVYLPGKTIPMLPEVLSNGICSLQPDRERFAKSVYITYDSQGNVLSTRFANSVIRSTQRLTYRQADRILKGHTKDTTAEVIGLLKSMAALSRSIEKRRINNGMLHLDLPETELVMDKSGRVVDAHPADDSYPHTIIEMFMVEANEAVARLLDRLSVDFIRRIHPQPPTLAMKELAKLVRSLGFSIPKTPDRMALQMLLHHVSGRDGSLAVNLVVLRSLEKAEYSPRNIGHFALASQKYCHFTSPIRRYADLLVHRVLEKYLQKELSSASSKQMPSDQDLPGIGKHISFTERRAEDAERELRTVLILQMLSKRIGEELDCVVTGLTSFGVFAQLRKFGIEGLIRTEDLGPDIWKYNAKAQCIVGLRSGAAIRLGRAIKSRIVSVNVPARHLNLSPVEPLVAASKNRRKRKPTKKSKKRSKKGSV